MRKLGKSQRRESENIIGKTFDSDGTGKKHYEDKKRGFTKENFLGRQEFILPKKTLRPKRRECQIW